MSNDIVPFSIVPKNLNEAMEFAKMIANSSFCPSSMRGKPGDVILAMQMGSEVGLNPMQAMQNIAVINGRPCLWGDAALAVVINSKAYQTHREWAEGSIKDGTRTWHCGITRKGSDEHVQSYSMEDAKKAGLWSKEGVWQKYPDRMLQMRARAFAIRDKFADALRGLSVREEVEDYEIQEKKKNIHQRVEIKPVQNDKVENTGEILDIEFQEPYSIEAALEDINNSKDKEELASYFEKAKKTFKSYPEELEMIISAKDKMKLKLMHDATMAYKNLSEGQ